ncbi:hypothetical protein DL93DRAFT_2157459 [Clavulina sp. PMI_390]|nr:hypothetical protein DL93DRAFT_2157459 [Clavulina sp. PMI_390]
MSSNEASTSSYTGLTKHRNITPQNINSVSSTRGGQHESTYMNKGLGFIRGSTTKSLANPEDIKSPNPSTFHAPSITVKHHSMVDDSTHPTLSQLLPPSAISPITDMPTVSALPINDLSSSILPPPAQVGPQVKDPATALLRTIISWANIVRPISHRYQTQLNPNDIVEFIKWGDPTSLRQAGSTALKSGFSHQTHRTSKVAESQRAVANNIQNYLLTQPADVSVFVSAVFGVDFSLLLGGKEGWREQLQIACDWVLVNWDSIVNGFFGPIVRVFVGIVLWYDILGALAQRQAPILKYLLESILAPEGVVQMPSVMGCANRVMLALAKTASLAYRVREQFRGSWRGPNLTIGEVLHQALEIRKVFIPQDLLAHVSVQATSQAEASSSFVGLDLPPTVYDQRVVPLIVQTTIPPSASTTSSNFTHTPYSPLFDPVFVPDTVMRWSGHVHSTKDVTHAFCMAGNVHLHAILLEYSRLAHEALSLPVVSAADIEQAANLGLHVLKHIPTNDGDRSIVWPLCVIGSAMRNQADREWFAERFRAIEGRDVLGNVKNAEDLMHKVWTTRESMNVVLANGWHRVHEPDWIDCMDREPLLLA